MTQKEESQNEQRVFEKYPRNTGIQSNRIYKLMSASSQR